MMTIIQNAPLIISCTLLVLTFINVILISRLMTSSNRIRRKGVIESFYSRLFDWSSETMDALAEAVHLCYQTENCTKNEFYFQANKTRAKMSKCIDSGRILLPSVQHNSTSKEFLAPTEIKTSLDGFYEGHLSGIFVPLLEVYQLLAALSYDDAEDTMATSRKIIERKIRFTELLSTACHPSKREALYVEMVENSRRGQLAPRISPPSGARA